MCTSKVGSKLVKAVIVVVRKEFFR